jgi:hypothetical protein
LLILTVQLLISMLYPLHQSFEATFLSDISILIVMLSLFHSIANIVMIQDDNNDPVYVAVALIIRVRFPFVTCS